MSNQKKEIEKIEMDIKRLREIVSHDANDEATLKARIKELKLSEVSTYGLEEHINHIKAKIDECSKYYKCDFEKDYISIKEIKESTFIKEVGCEILYKHKITISNLKICFEYDSPEIFMHDLETYEESPSDYKPSGARFPGGLYFEFKHNDICGFNKPMKWFLGHGATLSFIENHFEDVDVVARVQHTAITVLEFKDNVFERPVSIGKYSNKESSTITSSSRLEKGMEEQVADATCIIRMSDNKFDVLNIFGPANFYFEGRNIIKQLTTYIPNYLPYVPSGLLKVSSIHWGMCQKLSESKGCIFHIYKTLSTILVALKSFCSHKKLSATPKKLDTKPRDYLTYKESLRTESFLTRKNLFAAIQKQAIANNDVMQTMILQREIAKCDYAIVKSEKILFPWKNLKARKNSETWEDFMAWQSVLQNRSIFLFSKWISNYGTSWVRPLIWLVVLNLVMAWLAQLACPCTNSDFLVVFFELFNPTSYLPKLLELEGAGGAGKNAVISFLFIFQKIILAFTLYEMIKIFRRFGRR